MTDSGSIVFKFILLPCLYQLHAEGKAGSFLLPGPYLRLRFWWIWDW